MSPRCPHCPHAVPMSPQAQVAFLQGERKGQENLKTDLVRRIKMLEYALKQERSKYHKLKFGTEPAPGDKKPEALEPAPNGPLEVAALEGGPLAWKEGRQLLRQYLEEVGYSDTILDMRSRRVRALLARGPPGPGGDSLLVRRIEEQIQRNAGKEAKERGGGSVLEQVPFLRPCEDEDSDEDEDADGPPAEPPRQHKKQRVKLPPKPLLPEVEDEDDDDDSEDALNEFDFLGSGENGDGRRAGEGGGELGSLGLSSDVFIMDSIGGGAVSLGDLADLTVTNDNELSCDLSEGRDALKKTWNPKFTLRSHYDAVRGLAFHPAEAALLTASEDSTLKLWNLQKTVAAKKNAALDVEPVYAFRGHRGPVLAVAMGRDSALCCSGGVDACIRRWRLPDLDMDPYDGYDPGVLSGVLEGHGDAVWGLAFNPAGDRLASCSADGTVRLWDPRRDADAACLSTYDAQSEHGVPTSVTFSATEPGHAVVAFRTGAAVLYDVEAARALLTLESRPAGGGGSQINQVVSHPSQPLSITANDDRGIRFLDNRTGKVVHSMVAHLDAVTCLAVDPNGVFLMSGSKWPWPCPRGHVPKATFLSPRLHSCPQGHIPIPEAMSLSSEATFLSLRPCPCPRGHIFKAVSLSLEAMSPSPWPRPHPQGSVLVPEATSPRLWPHPRPCGHVLVPVPMSLSPCPCPQGRVPVPRGHIPIPMATSLSPRPYPCPPPHPL
uniref:Striatin 4 n=1 Tax=Anas platyrhynchos platyrhynchos TaxID=8840 RepID=A0A493T5Y7_ANAPP